MMMCGVSVTYDQRHHLSTIHVPFVYHPTIAFYHSTFYPTTSFQRVVGCASLVGHLRKYQSVPTTTQYSIDNDEP